MKKIKNLLIIGLLFILGAGVAFAAFTFIRTGENWDANVAPSNSPNDVFTLTGKLDQEDSRSPEFALGQRGRITGGTATYDIYSDLYGEFSISGSLNLVHDPSRPMEAKCLPNSLEMFSMSGTIVSEYWGEMQLDPQSFFCGNQYVEMVFNSDILGDKGIGDGNVANLIDDFGKQYVAISGVANLDGNTGSGNLARGDQFINKLEVAISNKTIAQKFLSKNISTLMKTHFTSENTNKAFGLTPPILEFSTNSNEEQFYLYDYSGEAAETITYDNGGTSYKNDGAVLTIGDNTDVEIKGKHTLIVEGGNIFIDSNTYNETDSTSLLILVAKKDDNGKGGNILINPDVTNIDAILIADGSLLSAYDVGSGYEILDVDSKTDELRKQLLIYGSVLSSNTIGEDIAPYGSDYYEDTSYSINESIYDLGNLRTFNLNYGTGTILDDCHIDTKLVPIANSNGTPLTNAWVGGKFCYNDDPKAESYLRGSDKNNPLIIDYNPNITNLAPYLLQNH